MEGENQNTNEDQALGFGDEDDVDLCKSMEKTRELGSSSRNHGPRRMRFPIAIAAAAAGTNRFRERREEEENKVVIIETDELVSGVRIDEKAVVLNEKDQQRCDHVNEMEEEPVGKPDEIIRESAVGNGLSGALRLLKDRGTLEEEGEGTVDCWVGTSSSSRRRRDIDRKMKEAYRKLCHGFHGKGPGRKKQEKRMKQLEQELKLKQTNSSDSMERIREAQAVLKTPYLVLSGNVKPAWQQRTEG